MHHRCFRRGARSATGTEGTESGARTAVLPSQTGGGQRRPAAPSLNPHVRLTRPANHWDMPNVELHFHLLPGVDDGPTSLEESVALARAAVEDGTGTIVATPHVSPRWTTDVTTIAERVAHLTDRLRREHIAVEVFPGAELDHEMVPRLTQAELELIAQGPRESRWLLLEAPLSGLDRRFNDAADELRARGFHIVVAHPDRSARETTQDWGVLAHELAAGSALQLNAWSLAGLYGDRVQFAALRLLGASGRVAISSDAHGPTRRPSLQLAMQALTWLGVRDPSRFVAVVPRLLLEGGLKAAPLAAAA